MDNLKEKLSEKTKTKIISSIKVNKFLKEQRNAIISLNDEPLIDSIIFIYSGHGEQDKIICSKKGNSVSIPKIRSEFSNEELQTNLININKRMT